MRSQPARVTVDCPICGQQMVVHVLFPTPKHRASKRPVVVDWQCAGECITDETPIRQVLQI